MRIPIPHANGPHLSVRRGGAEIMISVSDAATFVSMDLPETTARELALALIAVIEHPGAEGEELARIIHASRFRIGGSEDAEKEKTQAKTIEAQP